MITIKVVRQSSGEQVEGKKVSIGFSRGVTKAEYTDRNGEAHFDNSPEEGKVFVDGSNKYQGYLSGRVVVYI